METSSMKSFDEWWTQETNILQGGRLVECENYNLQYSNVLYMLKPLYDKMMEWGFSFINIDWRYNVISVGNTIDRYVIEEESFANICDFPRALKDAFKWMYDNRINREKLKCDWAGPCDALKRTHHFSASYGCFNYCPECGVEVGWYSWCGKK